MTLAEVLRTVRVSEGEGPDAAWAERFRKAGVPARLKRVEENSIPSWLWRSVPDEQALAALPESERFGSETDARQVALLVLMFRESKERTT